MARIGSALAAGVRPFASAHLCLPRPARPGLAGQPSLLSPDSHPLAGNRALRNPVSACNRAGATGKISTAIVAAVTTLLFFLTGLYYTQSCGEHAGDEGHYLIQRACAGTGFSAGALCAGRQCGAPRSAGTHCGDGLRRRLAFVPPGRSIAAGQRRCADGVRVEFLLVRICVPGPAGSIGSRADRMAVLERAGPNGVSLAHRRSGPDMLRFSALGAHPFLSAGRGRSGVLFSVWIAHRREMDTARPASGDFSLGWLGQYRILPVHPAPDVCRRLLASGQGIIIPLSPWVVADFYRSGRVVEYIPSGLLDGRGDPGLVRGWTRAAQQAWRRSSCLPQFG